MEDCCKRWKALRDRFISEMKKVKAKKSGEPGPSYTSNWPFFHTISFVADTVRHRP